MIFVLIPAFNEATNLERLLPAVPSQVLGRSVKTVVICDGSTDGTCLVAASNGADVIKLNQNSGKGSALRAGASSIVNSAFDAVVIMDGDGQHNPADMAALVRPVLGNECDIAIGSRYLVDPRRGTAPLNRYLVRSVFTVILRRRLEQPVTDPFAGYRCLSPTAFRTVLLEGDRYEGELEVRFEAELKGLTVVEVPIERIYGVGQSKMSVTGGRLSVLRGYEATLRRKTRELKAMRQQAPVA